MFRMRIACTLAATSLALAGLAAEPVRGTDTAGNEPGPIARGQIHVDVSTVGPSVSRYLTGSNVSYFSDLNSLWADKRIPAYLKQIRAGLLRYPGGEETSRFHWEQPGVRGYLDAWEPDGFSNREKGWKWPEADLAVNNSDHMDTLEYLKWCKWVGSEPMLGVNISSGLKFNRLEDSLAEIRRWHEHCRELGYTVKFWYVDNEPYHPGTYQRMDLKTYGTAVAKVARLLKRLNPEVQVVCNPVGAGSWGRLKPFLEVCGKDIDIIDVHWYWNWGRASLESWQACTPMTTDSQWRKTGQTYVDEIKAFRRLVQSLGYGHISLATHEWNMGPLEGEGTVSACVQMLVTAEMTMQFAQGGLHSACAWPLQWVWDRERTRREIAEGTYKAPRMGDRSIISQMPPHRPLPALQSFTLLGRMLEGRVVKADCSLKHVPVLAARKGDNLLLYVLNKRPDSLRVEVTIGAGTRVRRGVRIESVVADGVTTDRCRVSRRDSGPVEEGIVLSVAPYSLYLMTVPLGSSVTPRQ